MRDELELMEKVEQYLTGELSPDDLNAFEMEMNSDAALREAVDLQRTLMQGIGRIAVRQKVMRAGRRYHGKRSFIRLGTGAAFVVLIITAATFFIKKPLYGDKVVANTSVAFSGTSLPALNEAGHEQWAAADSLLPAQLFNLPVGRDTVIGTSGGMVLSIPGSAFLDATGKAAAGIVSLYIKEALDPATILQAGLSTRSGNQLLETGGMFFIDARQGNSILKINPAAGIYTVVPGDAAKPGMQLFSGRRLPGGAIDWQYPKPLSHDLLAVDIMGLDFYPSDYFTLLHKSGYSSSDKRFTDSVYYSLAGLFGNTDVTSGGRYLLRKKLTADSTGFIFGDATAPIGNCGINPAKIKAIWSAAYQNTLLATREFEQRLKFIHSCRNPALLDLYVNNLGKSLFEVDAMAVHITTGAVRKRFLQFAALHDGKVKNGSAQFDKLRSYYAQKSRLLTGAIAKTEDEIRRSEMQSDDDAAQKRTNHQMDVNARLAKNFREELSVNIESAYQQLGYKKAPAASIDFPAATYAVTVTNTGWSNVDRYVLESANSRTTLDYTDPITRKNAVITYKPITVRIADAKSYDRLLVYLIPDKLSCYMSMTGSDGIFTESLNGLMKYDLVCIGFKGSQRFFLKMNAVTSRTYDGISLKSAAARDVSAALNGLQSGPGEAINKAVDYAVWDLQTIARQRQRRKWEEMIADLRKSFFPCAMDYGEAEKDINSDALPETLMQ